MRAFFEKFFITLICTVSSNYIGLIENPVTFFLISLSVSTFLDICSSKNTRYAIYSLASIAMVFNSQLLGFLPILLLGLYEDFGYKAAFTLLIFLIRFEPVIVSISVLSLYLSINRVRYFELKDFADKTRDQLVEDVINLKSYQDQLKLNARQDLEISILSERNRISRELHDSIGHTLSSSILQVEALKLSTLEPSLIDSLSRLQNTLSSGMTEIREAIHCLHNSSMDLELEISKLASSFPKLDVSYKVSIGYDTDYSLKFDVLSAIKEALTNCIKHSDATSISISFIEHPAFYTLAIKDNGSPSKLGRLGIGLSSMESLAKKYSGIFNYSYCNGFKLYLKLMKGRS